MDALTKLLKTGIKLGSVKPKHSFTRKGRSGGPVAANTSTTRRAVKAGPTEEQKAEAKEKARKKREDEAAKKKAAAAEAKRTANAKKAEATAAKLATALATRRPFEAVSIVAEHHVIEKIIPRNAPIPNGFEQVGRSTRGNTIRIRKNIGPNLNALANTLARISGLGKARN
jgi:hypothetical protein